MKRYLPLILVFVSLLGFFLLLDSPSKNPRNIRLVVLLSADQFPTEYFKRFEHLSSGGLEQLREKGLLFVNAAYEHADTATCPGHAALTTGTHPSKNGIISNSWYNRHTKEPEYCVEDQDFKRSPVNLLRSSFGDWLKEAYPTAKVFSASAKDRAAIIMGGKRADAAYWYDKKTGEFISSAYYPKPKPEWLKEFNQSRLLFRYFGKPWTALPASSDELQRAKIVDFDEGIFPKRFPHNLGNASLVPDSGFYEAVYSSPFVDQYLADFAKFLIESEKLGRDEVPDFLALSFSALDSVGHDFGPNSPEVLDTFRRLDATLASLFRYLDENVGLEHVVIAFSADHGVQPLPEYQHSIGALGYRQGAEDIACIQSVSQKLYEHYGIHDLLEASIYFNTELLDEHKISRDELEKQVTAWVEDCPIIEKAWTKRELERTSPQNSPVALLFRNSHFPSRSPDITVQLKEFHLHSLHRGTGHGSPYEYDRRVPIIFLHPQIPSAVVENKARPVDVAPSLADFLELKAPWDLDGVSLVPSFPEE